MELNIGMVTLIASILVANIAGIIGAFIGIKTAIARLEVLVARLERDCDGLGNKLRNIEKLTTQKGI